MAHGDKPVSCCIGLTYILAQLYKTVWITLRKLSVMFCKAVNQKFTVDKEPNIISYFNADKVSSVSGNIKKVKKQ